MTIIAYIIAPKISRKMPDGTYTADEPFAWDAREYLRKKLVGKEVSFRVEYKLPFGMFPFSRYNLARITVA